jgi:outer membrane receptor protein involved in Fe transport
MPDTTDVDDSRTAGPRRNAHGLRARRLFSLLTLLAALISVRTAAAQSTNATLSGTLYDEQRHVLPGATASVRNSATGHVRRAVTDDTGTFHFVGLAPGPYELAVELPGFAVHIERDITLRIGEDARLEITMRLAPLSQTLEVIGADVPVIRTGGSEVGGTITRRQIEDLPVPGRDFTTLALLVPGVLTDHSTVSGGSGIVTAGQTGRDNAVALDGLSLIGTQSSTLRSGAPLDSIGEFEVLTNGFSAEYGQASGAVVNVLTRSGTNQFASRVFFFDRNDAWDATPAAARLVVPPVTKAKLQQRIVGGFAGGPLRRDRAFFFGAVEYTARDTEAIITSPVRHIFAPDDPSHLSQPFRHPQLFGRMDMKVGGSNGLTLRYRIDHSSLANRGVGGLVVRERGSDDVRTDQDAAILYTHVIGPRSLNEFRAQRSQWDFGFDTTNYCFKCSAINRPDIQLGGGGESRRLEDRWQIADSYTVLVNSLGSHMLKAGVDLSVIDHQFSGLPNSDGTFRFETHLPFDPSDQMTYPVQYTRAEGAELVRVTHNTYALFIQDQWKPRPDLTLDVGARWDYDTGPGFSRDPDNVAPRVGVVFDPSNDGRTFVRGSYGVYCDAVYLALARMTAQSLTARTTVLANPGFTDPFGPNPRRLTGPVYPPPSTQQLANDVETPYTQQTTIGFERVLGGQMAISADAVWARGRRLIFSRDDNYPDLDSPLPSKPRPKPEFQRVMVFETAGNSWYRGFQVGLRSSHDARYALSAAYTWSTSERDTEDFSFSAQDQRNPAAERGPSLSDVRHRLTASLSAWLPRGFKIAALVSARSGLPYNVTTGNDNNGDTFFTDRLPGVSRNSARGDDFWQTDVRLAKVLRVGPTRVEVLVEAFNVLNQSNWIGYNGDLRSLSFGKPTSSTDPRQIQLGIRVDF